MESSGDFLLAAACSTQIKYADKRLNLSMYAKASLYNIQIVLELFFRDDQEAFDFKHDVDQVCSFFAIRR